jgi:hypothetical protein
MKWLSAGLTFVNASTVFALVAGLLDQGLSKPVAVLSVIAGLGAASIAYWVTDAGPRSRKPTLEDPPAERDTTRKRRRSRRARESFVTEPPAQRYRFIWLWLVALCFAIFAVRSFCWLIYWDGNEVKVQSPNNLGDLSLHVTYIREFASGVPLWPDNPIHPFSKLRYPAGTDLFNAVLTCLGVDVTRGLVWAGLLASVATCYAFYRWAGTFGIAAFLFNGGVASFPFLLTFVFKDYQGANTIGWKSLPLALFVTQRAWLYAIPVGLLLLCQWRAKFFPARQESAEPSANIAPGRGPLPFWLELTFYATMPLFHTHTFIVLSVVLGFLFLLGNPMVRKQSALLAALAVIPATFFVWITTDHFHAGSFIKWQPGWVQNAGDFAMPFLQFWLVNFGAWVPLILFFLGTTAFTVWETYRTPDFQIPAKVAFLIPAAVIFLLGCLIKLAPWEWDNIKIIVWAYFLILPFLWSDLIVHWPIPLRIVVCVALFASGFVTLFGGLAAGATGYGIADRGELDAVGVVVRKLPAEARYAGFPTYNHPVLLQGRKMVLGYPGHLWTQGFNYSEIFDKLQALMKGEPNWKENARFCHARYLFWGREEKANYPTSGRPWERESALVATGDWGAIYDLESPRTQPAPQPGSVPRQ